jgi:hypothetical protein
MDEGKLLHMVARLVSACVGALILSAASVGSADVVAPPASPVDAAAKTALDTVSRTLPFQPTVILCPPMRILRPSDIPVPKPTKGLGLSFQW